MKKTATIGFGAAVVGLVAVLAAAAEPQMAGAAQLDRSPGANAMDIRQPPAPSGFGALAGGTPGRSAGSVATATRGTRAAGRFTANVTNPWYPLTPGTVLTYRGVKDGKHARDVLTVTNGVKRIDGVPCRVVLDRLYLNGRLAERTTDWYTQDAKGTVWYFGEATATLDARGRVTSTEGSWRAGLHGAKPGIVMPAHPRVGQAFRQEYSKGHAEDRARIISMRAHVKVPFTASTRALLTKETTRLEPGVVDHKYFVRGIGTVKELAVRGPKESLALVARTAPGGTAPGGLVGAGPCGMTAAVPKVYDHVIWITFENQSFRHVVGNTATQPYVNQLAGECGLATNFFPERHPSLPNYIAMTSGSTQGLTGDSSGPLSVDNIYNQVKQSGREWRQYAFGMPSNCYKTDSPSSSKAVYTAHHEAVIYYPNVAADCARWDIPVSPGVVDDVNDVTTSPLAKAIDSGTLPALSVIGPSDDGGNSTLGGEVDPRLGDPFLKRWITKITASATYRAGRTAIFITWDEGDDFSASPPNVSNIATIVVAPSVPKGARSATRLDHYSMLRATEEMLGIGTFLGNAANAPSMRSAFHM